jgi:hypothetical protein
MVPSKSAKPDHAKKAKPRKAGKAGKSAGKTAGKAAKAKAAGKAGKKATRRTSRPVADMLAPDEVGLVTLASEHELEGGAAVLVQEEAPPKEQLPVVLEQPLATEWSLPEHFLLVAIHDDWDDRMEKGKVGRQGVALVASLLFELALRGRLRIQMDRLQVVGEATGDPALDAFADTVREHGHMKARAAIDRLARQASRHIDPWRGRLHRRGVARAERWRFLGVLPRHRMLITDPEAKAKMENRLQRTLVGGTPDARTILLLGLIDAAGLLPEIIPEGALAFNRKRIHALLAGRDPLGYRVDPGVHDLQAALVEEILRTVRALQGT